MTNRHLLACVLATLTVLAAATARATSFVYDSGAAVAIPKSDYQVNPTIPSNEKIVAADWNQLGQAAYDLRQAILTGYFHGLTAQTATPPAPVFGIILYDALDGGGLWAEFPDAGTEQIFDGLQQMDTLWVRGAAGIDGGLIVGHGGVYAATGVISAGEVDFNSAFPFSAGSTVTISGDAVDGATALGVILNNDQALNTAGARIASFRNNNSTKAYVDYGGKGVFDGGVDLGVAGSLTAGASGVAVTSTPTDSVGHHAFSVNTTATLSGGADLVAIANNGATEFSVGATGITKGYGGFNANSAKLIQLAAGSASTDAVNVSQLGQVTSVAAYVPTGVAAGVTLATKTALGAGTARALGIVYRGWGCVGDPCSGWVTYEVKDSTSAASICSQSVPACCTNTASGCTSFNASAPVTTCTGTFALNDVLVVDETDGGACTTQGTAMLNFGGY